MTRPRVILGPSGAYWVRAETCDRMTLLGAPWKADLLVATLAYFRHALMFRLYAYAVLPKALEAVIQPAAAAPLFGDSVPSDGPLASGSAGPVRSADISKIMMNIKGSFAYWCNRRLRRRGSVWKKRFSDRLLLSAEEIRAATLQVHSRPAALGLSERPELFRYSGLTVGRNPVQLLDPLPVRRGGMPVPISMREAG